MKERIEKILLEYNLSPSRLADQMGIQRSGLSHIMSGRNMPSFDFLTTLLRLFPEIDANWLLTGKGEMYKEPNGSEKSTGTSRAKPQQSPELFTNEHFTANENKIESPGKAREIHIDDPAGSNISDQVTKQNQISDPDEVQKIILLLKNGKFKSFDKDLGDS